MQTDGNNVLQETQNIDRVADAPSDATLSRGKYTGQHPLLCSPTGLCKVMNGPNTERVVWYALQRQSSNVQTQRITAPQPGILATERQPQYDGEPTTPQASPKLPEHCVGIHSDSAISLCHPTQRSIAGEGTAGARSEANSWKGVLLPGRTRRVAARPSTARRRTACHQIPQPL